MLSPSRRSGKMNTHVQTDIGTSEFPVPQKMRAGVYRGSGRVILEIVPVPEIQAGEILIGVTAGFEPNGGGFAQYVRVMPHIVNRGMLAIPADVMFEEATFVEPVNTCLKAIHKARIVCGESVFVIGQGPIGLLLTLLARNA